MGNTQRRVSREYVERRRLAVSIVVAEAQQQHGRSDAGTTNIAAIAAGGAGGGSTAATTAGDPAKRTAAEPGGKRPSLQLQLPGQTATNRPLAAEDSGIPVDPSTSDDLLSLTQDSLDSDASEDQISDDDLDEALLSPRSQTLTNEAKLSRGIHNSCWTLYVDSTVTKPNLDTTLRCVALLALREMVTNQNGHLTTTHELFEQRLHKSKPAAAANALPDVEDIVQFLEQLFAAAQLSADSAIIMTVYVKRMLTYTQIALQPSNWRRILLGGLVMASKVWDDMAVWNVDFVSSSQGVDVADLNLFERFYLTAMDFNVNVKASIFAECYFVLRQVAIESKMTFAMEPLNADNAKRLEAQMRAYSRDVRNKFSDISDRLNSKSMPDNNMRRAKSENMFVVKEKQAYVM